MGHKKMGRPTDNPKVRHVQAKLDEDATTILGMYCDKKGVTESEAIRRGIRKLVDELKEK
jgi:hypothetical protein